MPEDWYAESLRLTFLGVTGWAQRPMFAELAGAQPAQLNAQPIMQMYQETGNVSDAYLTVVQQAGRVDIVLSDQPTRNTFNQGAPGYKPMFWVGPFKESIETFDGIMAKALSLIPSVTRIAFAITLVSETPDVRTAVMRLHKYLPQIDFDPNIDTDISFQINRPVRDRSGRLINRLGRWEAIQTTTVQIVPGISFAAPLHPGPPPSFAARIYVDVSSDANNTVPVSGDKLPELAHELREYAVALAENGDKK